MPSKARCSKSSPNCGIKDDRISCWSCLTVAAPTFLWPGPTLSRRHRVPRRHSRLSLRHRTCCGCASVLTVCCAGSKPVRPQTKTYQPRRANMQRPQLELWSAEPHPTPPIYQQLTPQQRSSLVSHLAELILKLIQDPPTTSAPSTQSKHHERQP
jgi:hypothetical protein